MKIKHKFFGIFAILCLMLSLGVVVAQDETISDDDINSVKDDPKVRNNIFTRVFGIEFKGFEHISTEKMDTEISIDLENNGDLTIKNVMIDSGKNPIVLSVNNLPEEVTEINYDKDTKKVTLSYVSGAELSLAQGKLDENSVITGVTLGSGEIKAEVGEGKVSMSEDGVDLTGNAKIVEKNSDGTIKTTEGAEKEGTGSISEKGRGSLEEKTRELAKGTKETIEDSTTKEPIQQLTVDEGKVTVQPVRKGSGLPVGDEYDNVFYANYQNPDGEFSIRAFGLKDGTVSLLSKKTMTAIIGKNVDISAPQSQLAGVKGLVEETKKIPKGETAPKAWDIEEGEDSPGEEPGDCPTCGQGGGRINQNGDTIGRFNREQYIQRVARVPGQPIRNIARGFRNFAARRPIRVERRRRIVRGIGRFIFKPRGLFRPRRY